MFENRIIKGTVKHVVQARHYALIMLCGALSLPTMAQVRFGDTISLVPTRGVELDFQITPDNRRVVYIADQETEFQSELFISNIDGSGTATKISGPLVNGGDVSSFRLSPDGKTVVYIADQDQNKVREIYSAPIDGSRAVTKLNGSIVDGGNVSFNFRITPDSRTVVYLADQDIENVEEIYRVPIDGSLDEEKLTPDLVAGRTVSFFDLSPDGQTVFYLSDQRTDQKFELFSVASDGTGGSVKIDSASGADRDTVDFEISPDGETVLYLSDQETVDVFELYSVALDGSRPIQKLNGQFPPGGRLFSYRISPDGKTVVYQAEQETVGIYEIFSAPIDASGSNVKLSNATTFSLDPSRGGGNFVVSPNSQTVVFISDANGNDARELFSVPIDGSGSVNKVNGELTQGGSVSPFSHIISADNKTVFYVADQETDGLFELYSAPISGIESDLSNIENSSSSEFVGRNAVLQTSSDGQFLVFNSGFDQTDNALNLFSVKTDPFLSDAELCIPIKAANEGFAIICL